MSSRHWILGAVVLSGCLGTPGFFGFGRPDGGSAGGRASGGGSSGSGTGGFGAGGFGAGGGFGGAGGFSGGGMEPPRASRSSTVALDPASELWFAVNPLVAELFSPLGSLPLPSESEPSAVAVVPGNQRRVVVALKRTGELALVDVIVRAVSLIRVCSEPAGVAVSPSGRTAVVACMGEPVAVLVDLQSRTTTSVPLPGVARAVAITNDGDLEDADEVAYVPLFFGIPTAEGSDLGRSGMVVGIGLMQKAVTALIPIGPVQDMGFGPRLSDGGEGPHASCSPNQLHAIAIAWGRAFVTHTCVSPEPPLQGRTSLAAGIAVIDLVSRTEDRTQSTTLGALQRSYGVTDINLMGVPIDVDVDARNSRIVILSQAASRVMFVGVGGIHRDAWFLPDPFNATASVTAPSTCVYPNPCDGGAGELLNGVPTGLVVLPSATGVLVNDATAGGLFQVSGLASGFFPYGEVLPTPQVKGLRFFFTGLGRWSANGLGSCGSCHPDGLSDNVTWIFPSGPRQTPSLDGTFAKVDPEDHRAQNWTAVFDEIHDVEGITRNLLGGRGALVGSNEQPLSLSRGISLDGGAYHRNDGLSGSTRSVEEALSTVKEWTDIEAYIRTVRPNRAALSLDPNKVAAGRMLFAQFGCAKCHAGPKWTVSRVPYSPSPEKNGSLPGDNALPVSATGLRTQTRTTGPWPGVNAEALKVDVERLSNPDGGAPIAVGPERITCVLRDVGTHSPLEQKADGTPAQGALGYNPPSLLGVATSAPYFHGGSAKTLEDVFGPAFLRHTMVGTSGSQFPSPHEVSQLAEFLRSIDDRTMPFPSTDGVDLCGSY